MLIHSVKNHLVYIFVCRAIDAAVATVSIADMTNILHCWRRLCIAEGERGYPRTARTYRSIQLNRTFFLT